MVVMCALDIVFNALFIFPTGTVRLGSLALPGARLGTAGAALGTRVLRIKAFAEPMYGASIVAGGVFQGVPGAVRPWHTLSDTAGRQALAAARKHRRGVPVTLCLRFPHLQLLCGVRGRADPDKSLTAPVGF